MRMKLNRGKRDVFRKRSPLPRILGWALTAVVIIGLGFFGAKWMTEHPVVAPTPDEQPTVESTTTAPTTTTTQPQPEAPEVLTDLRGFYLPHAALTADTLADTLSAAKQAGFNGVVFDLKDTEGNLYYRFPAAAAQQVNSYVEDALTEEQLGDLFTAIREAGLTPIPRLHAFRDNAAARALAAARIVHKDNAGWVWYDGDPKNGGKAWLNPYADEAHSYIGVLATELRDAGAGAIILDSVQFPHQLSAASFGNSSNINMEEEEVLALFVERIRETLGEECPVILSCTAQSALGTATQVYGGNPLTFGAAMAAPAIFPADLPAKIKVGETTVENTPDNLQNTVKELVAHMILRTKVLEDAPTVTPFLQVNGYKAPQVKAEIAGCQEGGSNSYILYNPKGTYDFAAY